MKTQSKKTTKNIKVPANASVVSLGECDICTEPFNQTTRKEVTAPCDFSACLVCWKTYLLSEAREPCCMAFGCKRGLTVEFIVNHMTRSFYLKDLRKHLGQILLEKEKSFLPAAQPLAEAQLQKVRHLKKLKELKEQLNELRFIISDVKEEYRRMLLDPNRNEEEFANVKAEYIDYRQASLDLKLQWEDADFLLDRARWGETSKPEVERRKFMMHCRTEGCNAFLSTQWKCELCERYTCKDCHESIGTLEEKKEQTHECKKENLESAELIKKDSKPCPACGVPIFRILGCNSMWCTTCFAGFNWNTMKIITGAIDNPHYFEWKQKNQGSVPRGRGDLPCGGLPCPENLPAELANITGLRELLGQLISDTAHVSRFEMDRYEPTNPEIMTNLRIKFLLGEIDEEYWQKRLFSIQKTNSFRHCVHQVLEMYTSTMISLYMNLTGADKKELEDDAWLMEQSNAIFLLIDYAREELKKIQNVYKQKIPSLVRAGGVLQLLDYFIARAKQEKPTNDKKVAKWLKERQKKVNKNGPKSFYDLEDLEDSAEDVPDSEDSDCGCDCYCDECVNRRQEAQMWENFGARICS